MFHYTSSIDISLAFQGNLYGQRLSNPFTVFTIPLNADTSKLETNNQSLNHKLMFVPIVYNSIERQQRLQGLKHLTTKLCIVNSHKRPCPARQ